MLTISDRYKILDGGMLKMIAIATMMIDHTAACLLMKGYIRPHSPIVRGSTLDYVYQFYRFLRGVGRIAFPIFCFFLVEGFVYTHSRFRYVMRLLLFGVLSEVVFDLALEKTFPAWNHQNVMFELALGVLMLWAFEAVGRLPVRPPELRLALQFAVAVPFIVLATQLRLDYGFKGLLLILLLYVLRPDRISQCAAGAILVSIWEWPALFAFVLLSLYNGERGRQMKYFFYAFYPVHLLILSFILRCMQQ